MSAPTETNKTTTDSGPESPTTAVPLDFDDDDAQSSGAQGEDGPRSPALTTTTAPKTTPSATSEAAPAKPPRPLTEAQKNETILKEAFPTVEPSVIRAILRASGGNVEPAFNALLEMTDPDAVKDEPEEVPPPQPPRPQGRAQLSQLEADELYARQLAEHFDNVGAYENRTSNRNSNDSRRQRSQQGQQGWNEDDREHSFIDDDLPVIRENLRKGFAETQTKVNSWITTLKKKLEENFDESEEATQRQGEPFRRPGESSRRSGDYDRYDADPQVLPDDFAAPANRPMANTGVYKPPQPSVSPKPNNGRRVGFKEETEEINMYDASPRVPPKDGAPGAGSRASKWQPLSSVDPNPIADNDPFSLGDSEDEKETKETKETKEKPKDAKSDDERLKQATADAMADSLVEDPAAKKS